MKLKERMQNSFFALSDNRLLGRKKLSAEQIERLKQIVGELE